MFSLVALAPTIALVLVLAAVLPWMVLASWDAAEAPVEASYGEVDWHALDMDLEGSTMDHGRSMVKYAEVKRSSKRRGSRKIHPLPYVIDMAYDSDGTWRALRL